MKRTNLYLRLLVAIVMVVTGGCVWAEDGIVYTLATTKQSGNNAYGTVYSHVEINGMKWSAPGNQQDYENVWRIGGKSITKVDREIYAEDSMCGTISKVRINHKGVSNANLIVNSVTLVVASDAAFTKKVKKISPTSKISVASSGSIEFIPNAPETSWETGCYYKIVINVSNSTSTNYGLDITSIVFYGIPDSAGDSEKTSTTTAFPQTSYNATIGEAFDAPVATVSAGGSTVKGAVLAYIGNNDAVATVDAETGAVALVGAGTVNITATYAGDETYDASSGSYVLTVADVDGSIVPGEEQTVTWVVKDSEYEEKQKLNGEKILKDKISILLAKEEGYNPYYDKSRQSVHFYNGNALTIAAAEGYAVTKIVMNYNSSITFGANLGTVSEIVAKSSTWTGFSPFVILKNKGGAYGELASVAVYYVELTDTEETVIVGTAGYGTFCPNKAVILGDGTVSSIIVGVTDGVLEQETIGVIPAGTGVLLTGEGTYKLYTYAGLSAVAPATNYLAGVLSSTTAPEGSYVLQNHDGVVAFYHVGETRPIVGANKAYLQLPAEAAKLRSICFTAEEANAVGISLPLLAEEDEIEAVYTLNGVRVGALQRGLNIVKMRSGRTEKRFVP